MNTAIKIKKMREFRGIKQADMAHRLHIEQSTYSDIESGNTRITTERLEQIAKIFEVPVEELWESDKQTFNLDNNQIDRFYGYIEHLHEENKEILKKSLDMLKEELDISRTQNATLLKALEKFADKK